MFFTFFKLGKWYQMVQSLTSKYTLLFYQPNESLHYHLIFLMKDTNNCFSRNFLFSMGCFLSCLLWKVGLIFPRAYFCDLGILINFHSTQIRVTS